MIYSYFKGTLTERTEEFVVIECGGVGYVLQMGPGLSSNLPALGEEAMVYAYLHFSQDRQQLFGFPDRESKRLFELLITVNSIGPKAAQAILEEYTPWSFAFHVMQGDWKALTKAKGIGKKGAERIIVDLKDKVKKSGWVKEDEHFESDMSETEDTPATQTEQDKLDIVEGLIFLGYPPHEAKELVKKSFDPEKSIEENLRRAMASARIV